MRMESSRLSRMPAVIVAFSLIFSASAAAQGTVQDLGSRASPYLRLGSAEYPILEYWISAGRINSLSPFTKPYRRIEIASALGELDESELSDGERAWLADMKKSFASELGPLSADAGSDAWIDMEFGVGGQFTTQTHRDLLRPELEGEFSNFKFLGEVRFGFEGAAGPFAGAARGRYHGIYREDAQFPGGDVVPPSAGGSLFDRVFGFRSGIRLFGSDLAFRTEEAYVEVQSRYGRLSFGQMYRNWGAPNVPGFLRSDYAYSEPEIGYRFGSDRVFLIGTFASYRDFGADTTHYVAIHRLEFRPSDRLMLSVSESSVHGGPGQGVDFRLINPLSIWGAARSDTDPPHNKAGQFDVWWRAIPGLTTYATLLKDASEQKGAGTVGIELSRLAPAFLLRANFSLVQSLTYRARLNPPLVWEEYSVERIGIGWDKTDLYLFSLEGEWFPRANLHLRPKLEVQVRGEGDLRQARPPPETLDDFPNILVGQTETTIRPALAGRWRHDGPRLGIDVGWDVGINFIRDYANTAGDDRTEVVGSLTLRLKAPR